MTPHTHNRSLAAYPSFVTPSLKMAIVSSGFALLLSAAVLSGSYVMHASAHQPSLETELRQMRGVSTMDMDGDDDGQPVSASILASQAAEQTREMSQPGVRTMVVTHHHERGAI